MANDYNVYFDGRAMQSNATDVPIHILDVAVGAPGIENTTIQPALMDGDIFARTRYMSRTISIQFVVMASSILSRASTIAKLCKWAASREPKKLKIPSHGGYIMAVCSSFPSVSAKEYWEPLTIDFVADDPFFQSETESSVSLAIGATATVTEYDAPDWRIEQEITSPLTEPLWGLGGQQLNFVTLPTGKLEIRRDKQTADIDGDSALPSLYLGSRFFDLKRGANVITVSGGAGGTLFWRERWL